MDYGICDTCKTIWDFQTIKFLFYWLSIKKKFQNLFSKKLACMPMAWLMFEMLNSKK